MTAEIHIENELDGRCLLFVNGQFAFLNAVVAKQLRSQEDSVTESHEIGLVHATALNVRFLLRDGCLEGESHLRIFIEREDVFHFKENADSRRKQCKFTCYTDTVNDVTRKTRNTLGQDDVYLTGFTVGNHFIELDSMLKRSTADTLICIDFDESPVVVLTNITFVVFLLKLVGRSLLFTVSGNTDIDGNSLVNLVIVKVGFLFFGRDDTQLGKVAHFSVTAFCFGQGFLCRVCIFVTHLKASFHCLAHRESLESRHLEGDSHPLYRTDSRRPRCRSSLPRSKSRQVFQAVREYERT